MQLHPDGPWPTTRDSDPKLPRCLGGETGRALAHQQPGPAGEQTRHILGDGGDAPGPPVPSPPGQSAPRAPGQTFPESLTATSNQWPTTRVGMRPARDSPSFPVRFWGPFTPAPRGPIPKEAVCPLGLWGMHVRRPAFGKAQRALGCSGFLPRASAASLQPPPAAPTPGQPGAFGA